VSITAERCTLEKRHSERRLRRRNPSWDVTG